MSQPQTTVMVGRDPACISSQLETETRRVLRCTFCQLNQFETHSGKCRRCGHTYPVPDMSAPIKVESSTGQKFGRLVRIIRRCRGLSQSEVAQRFGCNRSYMTKVEQGLNLPTIETFHRLARALNLPASALAHCYDVARH